MVPPPRILDRTDPVAVFDEPHNRLMTAGKRQARQRAAVRMAGLLSVSRPGDECEVNPRFAQRGPMFALVAARAAQRKRFKRRQLPVVADHVIVRHRDRGVAAWA